MMYTHVRLAASAIVLLAWSIPALAVGGDHGAAVIRAELEAWTQAFNARQADKTCGIAAYPQRRLPPRCGRAMIFGGSDYRRLLLPMLRALSIASLVTCPHLT